MAPGRDLVATDAGHRRAAPRTTCGPASTWPPRSARPACADPFYAADRPDLADDADERAAAYAEWRENLAPVVDHAAERGVRDRHRAAQPLRDLARQHRRPGARRRWGRCSGPALGLALDTYHLNIEERSSADAVRRAGEHLVHLQVCGNDRGAPGGDQTDWPALLAALDDVGYAGPLNIESFTPDNAAIAVAASIWRPLAASPDDLARDGLAFLRAPAPTETRTMPLTSIRRPTPLGVAVIGYSFMGKAHSNAWRNVGAFYPDVPPVRQQVLVGRDAAAVKAAADRYGWAESATDWRAVVERDDVDIVDICTPGHLHAEIALAALEAGKHVLVEKPLANSVAEAEAMVRGRTPRARGVRAMVGFNYRRVPALALARELIAEGRIGTVRQVRAAYLQDWLADADGPDDLAAAARGRRLRRARRPRLARRRPGAPPARRAVVVGDAATCGRSSPSAPAPTGPEPVTVDDAAWATLETASGVVASVEVSRMATGRKNGLHPRGLRRPRGRSPSTSSGSTSCGARRPGARVAGARRVAGHRGRPPLPRCLVAAGSRRSAGTTRSPRRPPTC